MDAEILLKRIEKRQEWLNGERVTDQYRKGYSDCLEFVVGWVVALEAVEEMDDEEEARQEYIREQLQCESCD